MAEDAAEEALHDRGTRGFDGLRLKPASPPTAGEAPSPAWLAQLGRAPIGDYAGGKEVVRRLAENGLAVPGDDPLYQYLGAQRVFTEILNAQHDDQLGRMRTMLDEARQGLVQLLADVAAAGGAAVVARRAEEEAAWKRLAAELEERTAAATRMLREAMAEERNATTAAVAVAVAEALAKVGSEKPARAGRGLWRLFADLGGRRGGPKAG